LKLSAFFHQSPVASAQCQWPFSVSPLAFGKHCILAMFDRKTLDVEHCLISSPESPESAPNFGLRRRFEDKTTQWQVFVIDNNEGRQALGSWQRGWTQSARPQLRVDGRR
jgi:hypothetical protein